MTTFIDPLIRGVTVAADDVAVICQDVRLDYRDLYERVRRLGGFLAHQGLPPGARVAILADNCHRYLETYIAVPSFGYVLVPLNTRSTLNEIAYALADSDTELLITDRPRESFSQLPITVLTLPDEYETALASSEPLESPSLDDSQLAGLFYTGGTTGVPKGVMLSHRNLLSNAMTALIWSRLRPSDRWLVMSPLFHTAGSCLCLASLWMGASQVILPRFSAAEALDLIEQHGVTGTLAVPTMLAALNEEQGTRPRDVATFRLLSHGASPAPVEILRKSHELFPQTELLHLYGTTETSPIATILAQEEALLGTPAERSCGVPAVGVRVEVRNPQGHKVPLGDVGEVAISGNNVTLGYWHREEETNRALREGWYYTGDLGYMDSAGRLYLIDRVKDMVVTGGENVYTIEIEDVLYRHPAVTEAAVFGIPDPKWGEAVHAVVVLRREVDVEELIAHCQQQLASFKVPKTFTLRMNDPLPKSGAGKILKRELREPYWKDRPTRV